VPAVAGVAPVHSPGQRAADVFFEVARYANHLCQIVWSFSFADRLDCELASQLKGLMLRTGRNLDEEYLALVGKRSIDRSVSQRTSSEPMEAVKEPELQLRLRGVSVVLKPPNWEVDAKGQLSSSGLYLSQYMQREHTPGSPVLQLPDFEYGFIHRLDVPSSGLILTGTHFEGYELLQWQMHTYTIGREYSVLLSCLVPSSLRDINAPVNDFLPGQSFVDEMGRPAETHLKVTFHVIRQQRRWSAERFGLVCIAIHTGRRHQIRVHSRWEGHPTVTDERYSHRAIFVSSSGLEIELGLQLSGQQRGVR